MASIACVRLSAGPAPTERLTRMLSAAPHRGATHHVLAHGRCALAVARDSDDDQTGIAKDGTFAAALSGKLDNFEDLVAVVSGQGGQVAPRTPAGALLAAWRLWGEGTPSRLRGAFAAILTDGSRIWAFRDHFGNALLFFHDSPQGFYAATEVKQVLAGAPIAREPNVEAIERYFLAGSLEDRSDSWFKGVRRVPISSLLTADDRGAAIRRYWDPTPILETVHRSEEQFVHDFERLMSQAVDRALEGRTVISLSGGLDSATVAAYAAPVHLNRTNAPIAALSAVYPDWPTVDESKYIKLIADALAIELHTFEPKANPFQGLREWAQRLDGPVPRLVAIHEVAEYYETARALGFRTILSGEFAEALNDTGAYLGPHFLRRGRLKAAARHYRLRHRAGMSLRGIVREVLTSVTPRFVDEAYRWRTLRRNVLYDWLDDRVVKGMMGEATRGRSWIPRGERWRASQLGPLDAIGVGFEAVETCEAYCGVRRREPWSDVDLFEYILSLPAELRFVSEDPRPKARLRQVLRGRLPDEIVDRRDKPRFGDYYTARVDYEVLSRWLVNPQYRMTGVRYDVIADHLARRDLSMRGFMWVRDLAAVHAFLSQW